MLPVAYSLASRIWPGCARRERALEPHRRAVPVLERGWHGRGDRDPARAVARLAANRQRLGARARLSGGRPVRARDPADAVARGARRGADRRGSVAGDRAPPPAKPSGDHRAGARCLRGRRMGAVQGRRSRRASSRSRQRRRWRASSGCWSILMTLLLLVAGLRDQRRAAARDGVDANASAGGRRRAWRWPAWCRSSRSRRWRCPETSTTASASSRARPRSRPTRAATASSPPRRRAESTGVRRAGCSTIARQSGWVPAPSPSRGCATGRTPGVTAHAHGFVPQTLADLGIAGSVLTTLLLVAWIAAALRATALLPRRLPFGPAADEPAPRRDWNGDRIGPGGSVPCGGRLRPAVDRSTGPGSSPGLPCSRSWRPATWPAADRRRRSPAEAARVRAPELGPHRGGGRRRDRRTRPRVGGLAAGGLRPRHG